MTYDEAEQVAYNPKVRSVKRLLRAAQRLVESGRQSDWKLAERARDRAKALAAAKPL